jgi:hypothetical protein
MSSETTAPDSKTVELEQLEGAPVGVRCCAAQPRHAIFCIREGSHERSNPEVTLNTLHEDLKEGFAEMRTGLADLKVTLVTGFRNMPTRKLPVGSRQRAVGSKQSEGAGPRLAGRSGQRAVGSKQSGGARPRLAGRSQQQAVGSRELLVGSEQQRAKRLRRAP